MQKTIFLTLLLTLSTYANETITLSTPKTNVIKDENITLNIAPSNINPKDITMVLEMMLKGGYMKRIKINILFI